MADIKTRESNQKNDRFASLTDSDLDKLLLEKKRQVFSQCSSNDTNRVFMLLTFCCFLLF